MALARVSFPSAAIAISCSRHQPLARVHSCKSAAVVTKRRAAATVVLGAAIGLGSWELWAGGTVLAVTGVLMASSLERIQQQDKAMECISRGMQLFSQGDVEGSLVEFDKALELDPNQRPYLWQRGLTLYYLDRFEEGANQFRDDVSINPNDAEEAIWCFLCEAQLYGVDEARKRFLEVGSDRRFVMRKVFELFHHGGDPEKILGQFDDNGGQLTFYSSLYTGLYFEAEQNADAAKAAITAAARSFYGSRSTDYMALVAKAHCARRGWQLCEPSVAVIE
ncbi:hypothetical protein O6H91_04G023600 [Diphasiastrum complanatum]|uniref:Uncharacterized protein n=3 Tax=Diphasiastrum complanatum TaxID=34168 RepID=A0ACC2DUZ5_DIPCM|nr:hypothetical protein O6H91_04G023600 [Diphasiastrum complanatum]KAJ7558067.1 hypothetical protein O6H91_04G023600 [Diphasiastrum complanatum]KAJ7558068.1 hypothetical protein O6H91_04G023600 [Diphasiastrum complanatum]